MSGMRDDHPAAGAVHVTPRGFSLRQCECSRPTGSNRCDSCIWFSVLQAQLQPDQSFQIAMVTIEDRSVLAENETDTRTASTQRKHISK